MTKGQVIAASQIGQLTFTPPADAFGPSGYATIGWHATDATGALARKGATLTIKVNPVADRPVTQDITITLAEDVSKATIDANAALFVSKASTATGAKIFSFSDGDEGGAAAQFTKLKILTIPGSDKGTVYLNDKVITALGEYSASRVETLKFVPKANVTGEVEITFQLLDSTGTATTTKKITYNITASNDAPTRPVLTLTDKILAGDEDGVIVGRVASTDAEGDTITYALSGTDAAYFSINASTGVITLKTQTVLSAQSPALTLKGAGQSYDVNVIATDSNNASSTALSASFNVYGVTLTDGLSNQHISTAAVLPEESFITASEPFFVGTLSTHNPGGGAITWSLLSGSAAGFTLVGNQIWYNRPVDGQAPRATFTGDAEASSPQNFTLLVKAVSGNNTLVASERITIGLQNRPDEAPTASDNTLTLASDATYQALSLSDFKVNAKDAGDGIKQIVIASVSDGVLSLGTTQIGAGMRLDASAITGTALRFTPDAGASNAHVTYHVIDKGDQWNHNPAKITVKPAQGANLITARLSRDEITIDEAVAGKTIGFIVLEGQTTTEYLATLDLAAPSASNDNQFFRVIVEKGVVHIAFKPAEALVGQTLKGPGQSYTLQLAGQTDDAVARSYNLTFKVEAISLDAQQLIPENLDASEGGFVVGSLTDARSGTASFALSGTDASQFAIRDGKLVFIGQDSGNFEAGDSLSVIITSTVNNTALSRSFSLHLADRNDAPTGLGHQTLALSYNAQNELAARVLGRDLFTMVDADAGDSLQGIRITSLPASGRLSLDGVAVKAGQFITELALREGKLVYSPATRSDALDVQLGYQLIDRASVASDTQTISFTAHRQPGQSARFEAVSRALSSDSSGFDYLFTLADFSFKAGSDGLALKAILLNLSNLTGTLRLNENGSITSYTSSSTQPVRISATDIAAGKLSYVAPAGTTSFGSLSITPLLSNNARGTSASFSFSQSDSGLPPQSALTKAPAATTNTLRVSLGNYNLTGTDANDLMIGGPLSDTLSGGAGDDTLIGGAGNDTLTGGAGDDTLEGGAGADSLTGGDGFDSVSYARASAITGTNIGIRLDLSLSTQTAGSGEATGDSFASVERFIGSGFNDVMSGDANINIFYGGAGRDLLRGRGGDDFLHGGAGADVIFGDAGADTLYGGADNDLIYGGAGVDRLFGGTGADSLFGDAGDDILDGGAGHDTLYGGLGDDIFIGGAGYDTVSYSLPTGYGQRAGMDFRATGFEEAYSGQGRILGYYITLKTSQQGTDKLLVGGAAGQGIERILGTRFDDVLHGIHVPIIGLAGLTIDGGAGFDTLDLTEAARTASHFGWVVNLGASAQVNKLPVNPTTALSHNVASAGASAASKSFHLVLWPITPAITAGRSPPRPACQN